MPNKNSFTETTSQSWISRLTGSIKSILVGFLLFIGSFVLLWYNEGRAVKTAKGLEQGQEEVISVESTKVDPSNDGKLIHVAGLVETKDSLVDDQFGIKINALKLKRSVEMYQWIQKSTTTSKKKIGGGEENVTTYSYEKGWNSQVINSSQFKITEGHHNPGSIPFASYSKQASSALIGSYNLSPALIGRVSGFQTLQVQSVDTAIHKGAEITNDGVNSSIYLGKGSSMYPEIGDVKISFEYVTNGNHSIISKQVRNSFEPFKTKTGTSIELIDSGIHSADSMFESAIKGNKVLTWILRFIGFFLMFGGLKTMFKPIVVFADLLPFLGSLLSMGLSLFCGIIAFALTVIVIAIAWIFYRPILGISLLVIGAGVFFYFYKKASKKKASTVSS